MEYEWDEVKHESNLLKHGLDFSDADLVLNIRTSLRLRVRTAQEMRWKDVAPVENVMVTLTLIYTYRQQRVRVISLRKASQRKRKMYDEWIHTP